VSRPASLPKHLQVPWRIIDAVVVFMGAWVLLPMALVAALLVLSGFLHPARELLDALSQSTLESGFIITLVDAVAGLALVWWFLRRYKADWHMVGWRRFDVRQAAQYILVVFFVFMVLAAAALWLVALLDPSFNAEQPQSNSIIDAAGTNPVLALAALVLIPPVIEETVFRGFIFPAIAKRFGFWYGAIGSSILFGVAHLQANVGVYTFVLGILLCFMYARLKSIFPGMALHMLNNYLAYLALTHVK
jgi:membrane protease YdiL (CAAX protease family)